MTEDTLPDRSAKGAVLERKRLLVVDDDSDIPELVADMMEGDGWETTGVLAGEQALAVLEREPFDLVLLDLKMPGTDGFEVLRRARPFCSMPIVALSGLHSLEDRERFMSLGGDDYITKPFLPEELRFRVRIALKRKQEKAAVIPEVPNQPPAGFDFSDDYLTVYIEARRVRAGGEERLLTPKEHDLLRELLLAGKPVSHRDLLVAVWGEAYADDTGILRVHVAGLRAKIEPDPHHPVYIITVPWFGYRFQTPSRPLTEERQTI